MFDIMDLNSDIEPVTALRRDAAALINRAAERHSAIVITQNGKPTAVLQDVASYERQQRVLHLLKLAATGERDFDARRVVDSDSVTAAVRARVDDRQLGA